LSQPKLQKIVILTKYYALKGLSYYPFWQKLALVSQLFPTVQFRIGAGMTANNIKLREAPKVEDWD
jgi:hypothetical protein